MRNDAHPSGFRRMVLLVLVTGLALVEAACGGSPDPASSPASTQAMGTPTG
jgi:hypothetical protein